MGLGTRHHFAVGADVCGGWLSADGAGMQHGLVFLSHRGRGGFGLALFVEKTTVESLLGAWGFRLKPI